MNNKPYGKGYTVEDKLSIIDDYYINTIDKDLEYNLFRQNLSNQLSTKGYVDCFDNMYTEEKFNYFETKISSMMDECDKVNQQYIKQRLVRALANEKLINGSHTLITYKRHIKQNLYPENSWVYCDTDIVKYKARLKGLPNEEHRDFMRSKIRTKRAGVKSIPKKKSLVNAKRKINAKKIKFAYDVLVPLVQRPTPFEG